MLLVSAEVLTHLIPSPLNIIKPVSSVFWLISWQTLLAICFLWCHNWIHSVWLQCVCYFQTLCLLTGPSRLVISQLESVSQNGFTPPTHTRSVALLSGTTQVSRYQKGRTNPDFTEARDSEWQWHQLDHMQVCTSLQTDNHTSTPPLCFFRPDALPATQPTVSKHWRQIREHSVVFILWIVPSCGIELLLLDVSLCVFQWLITW